MSPDAYQLRPPSQHLPKHLHMSPSWCSVSPESYGLTAPICPSQPASLQGRPPDSTQEDSTQGPSHRRGDLWASRPRAARPLPGRHQHGPAPCPPCWPHRAVCSVALGSLWRSCRPHEVSIPRGTGSDWPKVLQLGRAKLGDPRPSGPSAGLFPGICAVSQEPRGTGHKVARCPASHACQLALGTWAGTSRSPVLTARAAATRPPCWARAGSARG